MEKTCYYEVLQVERTADSATVKKAYRQLALKYHPDRNPDDPEAMVRFREAAEAYEVLSDPEKRRIYDVHGHQGLSSSGFSSRGFSGVHDIFSAFSDVFEGLFGFGGHSQNSRRGRDLLYEMEITLEEAATGKQANFTVPQQAACEACNGQGQKDGQQPPICPTCKGHGQVIRSQGFFQLATTCPDCKGQGRKVSDPCPECQGQGRVQRNKDLSLQIPPGIASGQRLRLTGEGQSGAPGQTPGDLLLQVKVSPHRLFQRQGNDLYCHKEVSMTQAALGRKVMVETLLDGPQEMILPPGIQSGDVLTMPDQGMPNLKNGQKGRLHVQVVVNTPRDLSAEQVELLEKLAALEGEAAQVPPRFNGKKKRWSFKNN